MTVIGFLQVEEINRVDTSTRHNTNMATSLPSSPFGRDDKDSGRATLKNRRHSSALMALFLLGLPVVSDLLPRIGLYPDDVVVIIVVFFHRLTENLTHAHRVHFLCPCRHLKFLDPEIDPCGGEPVQT